MKTHSRVINIYISLHKILYLFASSYNALRCVFVDTAEQRQSTSSTESTRNNRKANEQRRERDGKKLKNKKIRNDLLLRLGSRLESAIFGKRVFVVRQRIRSAFCERVREHQGRAKFGIGQENVIQT